MLAQAKERVRTGERHAGVGAEVTLDQVLVVGEGDNLRVGQPTVARVAVKATFAIGYLRR